MSAISRGDGINFRYRGALNRSCLLLKSLVVRGFFVGRVAPARRRRDLYVYQAITDRRAYQPYDAITA
jgi:hypothetical protein